MHLWVLLTPACNLTCGYCFQRLAGYHENTKVPQKNFDALLQFLERHPVNTMTIIGGEALLAQKNLRVLLEKMRELKVESAIITNGTVYVPWLKEYKDVLKNLQVSVDGPAYIHNLQRKYRSGGGSYEDILKNMNSYLADGFHVTAHMVIPKVKSRDSIESIAQLMMELPAQVSLGFEIEHHPHQNDKEMLPIAKRFYKEILGFPLSFRKRIHIPRRASHYGLRVCQAGVEHQAYDVSTGKFYSCHESAGTTEDIVGEIFNDPVFDAKALEKVVKDTDGRNYRIWWLPRLLSEVLKYIIPLSICWKQFSDPNKKEYVITPYELYLGWMQLRHHKKFGEEAEVV